MTKRPKRRKYKIMRTRRAFVTADIRKSAREAVSDERADLLEQLSTVEPDGGILSGPDVSPSAKGEAKPSEALARSTVASHHMTAQSETDAFGGEGRLQARPGLARQRSRQARSKSTPSWPTLTIGSRRTRPGSRR